MRCINCGLAVGKIKGHIIFSLPADHLKRLALDSPYSDQDSTQEPPECSASQQSSPTQDKTFERVKDFSRLRHSMGITELNIEDESLLTNDNLNTSEDQVTGRVDPLSHLQDQSINETGISIASKFAQSDLKREGDDDVSGSAREPSGLRDNLMQTPSCSRTSDFHKNKILEYRIKLEDEIGDDSTEPGQPIYQVNIDMERNRDFFVKDEIKVENDSQCNICFSVGRKMYPIETYSNIYKKLLHDGYDVQNNTFDTSPTVVCFECKALLRNVEKFQNRIRKANEMLQTQQNTVTLSSLTTVVISDTSPETMYLTGENTEQMNTEQMNTDSDDVINCDVNNDDVFDEGATVDDLCVKDKESPLEDSILKIRNKWAKKRVLINKEPKFRRLKDRDVFKKVSFENQVLQDVLEECRSDGSYESNAFKCLSCVRRFDDRSALIEHNIQQHDETIGSYSCDICCSRFTDKQMLSNHILSHYYMYYCKLCDYKCCNEDDKNSHARAQHRNEAYECLKCDRLFVNRRKFYEHYKVSHETYICDYCGVKYKMKDSLITHIRKKHTKRECTICKKEFKRYNSLWLHNKLHHAPAQGAYCVECDVSFADAYRYRWHLANSVKHTPRKAVRSNTQSHNEHINPTLLMTNHKICDRLVPQFDNEPGLTDVSNDQDYMPSPCALSSDDNHVILMDNVCSDGSHEVSSSQVINTMNQDKVFLREIRPEEHTGDEIKTKKTNLEAENNISKDDRKSEVSLKGKRIRERDFCIYCETFILNFSRHMIRKHSTESEVQLALSHAKNTVERKRLFSELRKKCNYVRNTQSDFKPMKKCRSSDRNDYLPCPKCLGFYHKKQLWRHRKQCKNVSAINAQIESQNFLIRHVEVDTNLRIKVFSRMRPDRISLAAKTDKLICMFGAQYLKQHREEHFVTVVSRKMRELAKLLLEVKKIKPNIDNLEQVLRPKYYEILVNATKVVARYNDATKKFDAPTYAMNIATSLKECCSIALLEACKMETSVHSAKIQRDLRALSEMIADNWKFDITGEAPDKTNIVSLAADLKLFNDYLCKISKLSSDNLKNNVINVEAFNDLVESTYCRVLLLNRHRPIELGRIILNDYNERDNEKNEEFEKDLSSIEKILISNSKTIVIRDKRGRVPILLTNEIQNYIKTILTVRHLYVNNDNDFLFVNSGGSKICDKVLEKYAKSCGATNYRTLMSTRLRRHIATTIQLFSMNDTEIEQLATFLGQKLSVVKDDIYQTAKISKLLLRMEDDRADQYKGKAFDEIDLNLNEVDELEDETQHTIIPRRCVSKQLTPIISKKTRTLVPWTVEQKNVVNEYFKQHIQDKKSPRRAECERIKKEYPTLLQNKDWLKIKVFIQNIYKKK